jgi:hypothetical protein
VWNRFEKKRSPRPRDELQLRHAVTQSSIVATVSLWFGVCNRGSGWLEPSEYLHRLGLVLEHLHGVPWARIGEQVGQRNLAVTANTYTHVLGDETELDHAELLR